MFEKVNPDSDSTAFISLMQGSNNILYSQSGIERVHVQYKTYKKKKKKLGFKR